jgi:hypothetical protein
MTHVAVTHVENPGPLTLAAKWRAVFVAFTGIGVVTFVAGLFVDPVRAWHNFVIAQFMFLLFALAGLFFTAMHHAVNASWVIAVRRVAEGMTAYLPLALAAWIVLAVFGLDKVYPWAAGTVEFSDPLKVHWLSPLWVGVRDGIFILIWIFFARKLTGYSVKQDETGDPWLSRKAMNWSIAFMPFFAGTFSLMSFDLMMSLEPRWYSTMFGVYCFAGLFQSGLALITLIFLWLKRSGPLAQAATASHAKDLGTLLFAFTIFMTYIGFSQYMLIWYANLPEETFYFAKRMDGGWIWLFVALPLVKFAIPFFGLLSQAAKKNERWLMAVCWVVIVGQYLDIYWMTMPAAYPKFVPISWMEIGTFLLFAGAFGLAVTRFFSKHSVLAARDPRILDSVNWRFWE